MLNVKAITVSNIMTSHCVGTVQMREESESGIRKWEEMWFKTTAEDEERGGQQWRAMEDCSTDERLQQETVWERFLLQSVANSGQTSSVIYVNYNYNEIIANNYNYNYN